MRPRVQEHTHPSAEGREIAPRPGGLVALVPWNLFLLTPSLTDKRGLHLVYNLAWEPGF